MNEEIYKSLSRCLRAASARQAGAYRHMASGQVLQLEFAPFINRIISPPLRPVSNHSKYMLPQLFTGYTG